MFSFQDGIAEQFDENCIDITVSQGKTQLQQIELTCRWSDLSINRPVPTLECQWYNKQKDSLELIPKVTGTFYQPCLADLNSK